MKRFLFITIAIFSLGLPVSGQLVPSQARTNGWAIPGGELTFKLYWANQTASAFYRTDGDLIDRFRDPADPDSVQFSIDRQYTVDFTGQTVGVYGEYGLFKNLTLVLDVPVTRWNLHERYSYDSTFKIEPTDTSADAERTGIHIRRDRAEFSRLQPQYYGIGGRYAWMNENSLIGISGMLRIPPGFKNDTRTDSTGEFLNDYGFEGIAGVNLGLTLGKNWLSTSIRYNMRGGDFEDEMQFYTEFGARSVETTQIILFAQYIQSVGSFEDNDNFNPRKARFLENYFHVGAAFEIEFQKRYSLSAGYDVRLAGKNTWALSTFSVGAGVRFPEL